MKGFIGAKHKFSMEGDSWKPFRVAFKLMWRET